MEISKGMLDNVLILSADVQTAQTTVERALSKVGKIVYSKPGSLEGIIKYGLNPVKLKMAFVEKGDTTQLTIQTSNQSVYSGPNKSAIERLTEALLNADSPDYRPDKSGLSKTKLFMSILLFLILFGVVWGALMYVALPILLR